MKLKHRQAFVLGILYRLECIQLMRAADVALFVFCIHITDEYAEYTVKTYTYRGAYRFRNRCKFFNIDQCYSCVII